jgi:hypothetical protein
MSTRSIVPRNIATLITVTQTIRLLATEAMAVRARRSTGRTTR